MSRSRSPGSHTTAGRAALSAWAEERGRISFLASQLGISAAAVSQWVLGNTRPDTHFRIALERLIGIPADKWLTATERAIAYPKQKTGTDGG